MKRRFLLLAILFLSSCSSPLILSSLEHMKKSESIENILDDINDLNYDESYSELDRDRLRLKYAKSFHHEVSALTHQLKKRPNLLPNHQPIKKQQKEKYQKVITLLEENLHHLDAIIKKQKGSLVLKAIKSTKQSCILCHSEFKHAL